METGATALRTRRDIAGILPKQSLVQRKSGTHAPCDYQDAIRRDGEANRAYIKDDIAITQGILNWALAQAAALEYSVPPSTGWIRPKQRDGMHNFVKRG
jgi:hypothetical protein